MSIPVECIGSERQRVPAVLIKIEKSLGLIKFSSELSPIKVPLSELQLAPSAFDKYSENVFEHTEVSKVDSPTTDLQLRQSTNQFAARDPVEVWLSTEATTRKKLTLNLPEDEEKKHEPSSTVPSSGAWWPGRVLTIQGGFAHVEVAAPLGDNLLDDSCGSHVVPHVVRMGSSILPYRSTLVKLNEVRLPWIGRPTARHMNKDGEQGNHVPPSKEYPSESVTLATPGVLRRHTICIPAYLARLASSVDSHCSLIKFCDAPCLVQCDPEPFLSNVLAKRILADCNSTVASGRQTPNADLEVNVPTVTVSADSHSAVSPSWPSACSIAQSTILNAPNIAGTLSPAGVTDPALLLEGLPGAHGPLVLLHIYSGSPEAIRRATLLELAHVRILAFRYHVMLKLSSGVPGELDLADSMSPLTENGDAPVMHCKPISIPVLANSDNGATGDRSGDMMIGYSAQFRIQPQLIGLAIGHRGSTIQEARSIPGVRAIDLLPEGVIHVEAETVEACQAVRNLLDFTEAEIPVSPRLASRLIGSKGINIRKLAASAGIRRAQLLDPLTRKRRQQQPQLSRRVPVSDRDHSAATSDHSRNSLDATDEKLNHMENIPESSELNNGEAFASNEEKLPPPAFYLLGTRAAVAKMRLLLEFQADNWNELDELEETRRNLSSQLRLSTQPGIRSGPVPVGHALDINPGGNIPRTGVIGPRGRGRRPLGRGGPVDVAPEGDSASHQLPNRASYRGRPRGGSGHSEQWPLNRGHPQAPAVDQPTSNGPGPSGTNDVDRNHNEAQSGGSPHPVNGLKRGPEGRGRGGRNHPRNSTLSAS